jgi:murein DD-endopeptidase MepM/ murein hydrolase activator NlpD
MKMITATLLLVITIAMGRIASNTKSVPGQDSPPTPAAANVFGAFMHVETAPSDGFDFACGNPDGKGEYIEKSTGRHYNGWRITAGFTEQCSVGIHPGEDWSGAGGGNADLGQPVYSVANGRVVFADDGGKLWGNVIVIDHIFYENYERKKMRSVYAHLLEIKVRAGEDVKRRQIIGAIGLDPDKTIDAHLHLELRWDETLSPNYSPSDNGKDRAWVREHYAEPSAFIRAHRKLFVPQNEPALLLVDQRSYKMRLYRQGKQQGEYDVSFGQGKGQKRLLGDNKTPKGMYFVTDKRHGKFDGAYGGYYGGYWIKINYPNRYDAARGRAEKIITPEQEAGINKKWAERLPTLGNTGLGGGIGFHGWIKEWENSGPRHLSWGCVVMHIFDISALFDQIPPGTMVIIF